MSVKNERFVRLMHRAQQVCPNSESNVCEQIEEKGGKGVVGYLEVGPEGFGFTSDDHTSVQERLACRVFSGLESVYDSFAMCRPSVCVPVLASVW